MPEEYEVNSLNKQLTPKRYLKKIGTAFVGGDFTGNARGANAVDIQSSRSAVTQVASGANSSAIGSRNTASGYYSSAVGYQNTASGNYSSAFGYYNTASGNYSSAIGYYNTASGNYSSAIGYYNTASGNYSSAIGYYNTASGNYSSAIGYRTTTTVNATFEAGYWSNASTRAGAIRTHSTGQVSATLPTTDTAFEASAAANGSEVNGSLAQGMFSTRLGGTDDELITEVNDAGEIRKFSQLRIESNGAVTGGDLSGNARGANALDIQSLRSTVTQVASGEGSSAIGFRNTASGYYSSAVGFLNTASGNYSSAVGFLNAASEEGASAFGYDNTASGERSLAVGFRNTASGERSLAVGFRNTASGERSSAVGFRNTASGERSSAIGSFANSSIYGEIALNNSNTATSEQISKFVLRKTTTNATQTTLSLSEGTQNLVLPSDTHLGFTCKVMGVSSAGVTNMYTFRGFIKNVGGTTTLSTTVVKEEFEEDTDWDATIEANDTTDSMDIKVTGEVATTIKWAATLDCVKIDNS